MSARPPRTARFIIRALVRAPLRAAVLRDLDALFRERSASGGRTAARRWYWEQAFRAGVPALRSRFAPARGRYLIPGPEPSRMLFVRDLRLALRSLLRDPMFTLAAIAVLALGVGASTATYSIVRAVILTPLPYGEADRLVVLWHDVPRRDRYNFALGTHDVDAYRGAAALSGVAGTRASGRLTILVDEKPIRVPSTSVTVNLLQVLRVSPLLGPGFAAGDAEPLAPDAPFVPTRVMISERLWRTVFAADPDIVGKRLELGASASEIAGVMPPGFGLLLHPVAGVEAAIDVWFAVRFDPTFRNTYGLRAIARLAPGASLEQAQAEVDAIVAAQHDEYPVYRSAGVQTRLAPMRADLTRGASRLVWTLFAAAAGLLLVACTNLTGLIVLRGSARARETAIQRALGASRAALVGQAVAEAIVLAACGATSGVSLAGLAVRVFGAIVPADVPRLDSAAVSGPVLLFGVGLTFAVTLAATIWQALRPHSASRLEVLRQGGSSGSRAQRRTQRVLVGAGVALSFALLLGSTHMIEAFVRLQSVDPGFEGTGVVSFRASPSSSRFETRAELDEYLRQLGAWLRTVPGAESVGAISVLPLSGTTNGSAYGPEEAVADGDETDLRMAEGRWVRPGYFETVRAELIEGRFITEDDQRSGAAVVVVDHQLAERHWPGRSAVGQRIVHKFSSGLALGNAEIVGVIRHQQQGGLAPEDGETIYAASSYLGGASAATWVVRTADPSALVASIRAELSRTEPDTMLTDVRLLDELTSAAQAPTRFATLLVSVFGVVGLALAMAGLQSMLARVVNDRRREIGIRVALGSQARAVVRLVALDGLLSVALGVLAGAAGGLLLTRYLTSMLPEVLPTGPAAWGGSTAAFLLVGLLACAAPLRSILRVSPLEITRAD